MKQGDRIDYIELYSTDLTKTKEFYSKVFCWEFTDYGPDYTSFSKESAGLDGGFEKTNSPKPNGAIVILYHPNLEEAKENVISAGGRISKDIFSFPGGRRFHFTDPTNNELAIWSDK